MRGEPAVGAETLNQSRRTVQLPRTLIGTSIFRLSGHDRTGRTPAGCRDAGRRGGSGRHDHRSLGHAHVDGGHRTVPDAGQEYAQRGHLGRQLGGRADAELPRPVWRVTASPTSVASVTCLRTSSGRAATTSRAGPAVSNVAPGAGGVAGAEDLGQAGGPVGPLGQDPAGGVEEDPASRRAGGDGGRQPFGDVDLDRVRETPFDGRRGHPRQTEEEAFGGAGVDVDHGLAAPRVRRR